jgi:hypothetical protein
VFEDVVYVFKLPPVSGFVSNDIVVTLDQVLPSFEPATVNNFGYRSAKAVPVAFCRTKDFKIIGDGNFI